MSTGKEGETFDLRRLPSKQVEMNVANATSKTLTNRLKGTLTQSHSNKLSATAKTSVKTKSTTATVSKITKLVLKPKPTTSKSSLTSKVTTKKYSTKPVTIKSRSTVISHESTFRVRNIKKSPPNKRQNVENTSISVKSEQISHQITVNTYDFNTNTAIEAKKPFEMVQSEHSGNITSLNVTKIVNSPVLQEITSVVVNGSNVMKNTETDDFNLKVPENVKGIENSPQKSIKHCDNDLECKSKSYDPIKARQFIRMQREKWKEAEKTEKTKTKSPASKEEIKQRLSALRKNTLKIVAKNVQKARNTSIEPKTKKFVQKKSTSPKKTAVSKGSEVLEQSNAIKTPQLQQLSQSKIASLALTPSKFLPSIKSKKNRIGILRRAEEAVPLFDAASYTRTPPFAVKRSHRISNADCSPLPAHLVQNRLSISGKKEPSRNESSHFELELKIPETIPLKSTLFEELKANDEQHWPNDGNFERNMNSDDDNVANRSKGYIEHGNIATGANVTTPKQEIPFWLRPTPVQPYPYNFIMAVRKKLESITHPVLQSNKKYRMKKASPYRSPVARPDTKFVSKFQQNLNRRTTSESESLSENAKSTDVSPEKSQTSHVVNVEHSKGQTEQDEQEEEYSMNFSSVTRESIHEQSNILSKSKRKSVRASQDTLSISSGILSHSSPEKKMKTNSSNGTNVPKDDEERQPSPLTTDNVDGLQITSHSSSQFERTSNGSSAAGRSVQSMQAIQTVQSMQSTHQSTQPSQSSIRSVLQSTQSSSVKSYLNFRRGKDYTPSKQPSLSKLRKQKNVEDLLRDFTSSLSKVMEVNKRLHTILSNPPSSRSSKYSDDFENASDNKQSVISEHIVGTHDSTSVPSYRTQHTLSERHSTQSNGQYIEDKNDSTEVGSIQANESNTLTGDRISEQISGMISNEMSILSSTRNPIKNTYSIEESQGNENRTTTEPSSHVQKESSTLIEEKINESQTSESPTNNDLKSVSLSIAKKSAATSDDTDQPSNAIETFSKQITKEPDVANESIGSDIFNIFNKTSMNLGDEANTSIWSEHNVSYSTLGMCDQLLKSETHKSEDLATLLKMREKALIDRFKGQVAWLELQKQKFRESGLTTEISKIKKKQRALLLRLNNDRKELHRILKDSQQSGSMKNTSNVNFNISHMTTNMSIRRTSVSKQFDNATSNRALKAIELPGGGSALEIMLQRRENELRRRREHVEKLLKWHQLLDIEEQEVIKMEQMIMFISTSDVYQTTSHEQINDTVAITLHHRSKRTICQRDETSVHERSLTNVTDTISMEQTRFEQKKQKQIHKIEKSLNTLKMVSTRSISSDIDADDVVEISGRQLNKLWKRLTGEYEEKYTPDKVYTLSKFDLEQLYEQAKLEVLKQFHASEEFKRRLIDNSMSIIENHPSNNNSVQQLVESNSDAANVEKPSEIEIEPIVPTLNLASSPELRENIVSDTDQGYYFSNSNIEQSSAQHKQTAETVVEATSQTLDGSQIHTEEQIEEDEQSTSHQEKSNQISRKILSTNHNRAMKMSVHQKLKPFPMNRKSMKVVNQRKFHRSLKQINPVVYLR